MPELAWPGYPKLIARLSRIENLDCRPLMTSWTNHLVEGNRRGVLSGVDGNDVTMPPLKYRGGSGTLTRKRRVPNYGTSKHEAVGGVGGNLTTAQYKLLSGPRLAPRGDASRVVKNLMTEVRGPIPLAGGGARWEAVAAWFNVVSARGFVFLPVHFNGSRDGRIPRYDLRPVRKQERQYCRNDMMAFAKQVFFGSI